MVYTCFLARSEHVSDFVERATGESTASACGLALWQARSSAFLSARIAQVSVNG